MKSFIIMNGILLILAVVGSFVINKLVDEGIFMGVNRFFIDIYINFRSDRHNNQPNFNYLYLYLVNK